MRKHSSLTGNHLIKIDDDIIQTFKIQTPFSVYAIFVTVVVFFIRFIREKINAFYQNAAVI